MAEFQISGTGKKETSEGFQQGDRVDIFGSPMIPYGKAVGWGKQEKGSRSETEKWPPLPFVE